MRRTVSPRASRLQERVRRLNPELRQHVGSYVPNDEELCCTSAIFMASYAEKHTSTPPKTLISGSFSGGRGEWIVSESEAPLLANTCVVCEEEMSSSEQALVSTLMTLHLLLPEWFRRGTHGNSTIDESIFWEKAPTWNLRLQLR